jgi:hypothetical protein
LTALVRSLNSAGGIYTIVVTAFDVRMVLATWDQQKGMRVTGGITTGASDLAAIVDGLNNIEMQCGASGSTYRLILVSLQR